MKDHWENIYQTKQLHEVSWFQATPTTSLAIIETLNLPSDAKIIDVGGGDSYLVDNLLSHGFNNLSVLDISKKALERAQARLGKELAANVTWIEGDISKYEPQTNYDCWHDRAAFHFLTEEAAIAHYVKMVSTHIVSGGHLVIATFAEDGPLKCSGLNIKQYTEESLSALFSANFDKVKTMKVVHKTPFETEQSFVWAVLRKR